MLAFWHACPSFAAARYYCAGVIRCHVTVISWQNLLMVASKRLSIWTASIHCLAVEFDNVAIGVDDIDLRKARDGLGTELHLPEVVVGKILLETFAAEPQ